MSLNTAEALYAGDHGRPYGTGVGVRAKQPIQSLAKLKNETRGEGQHVRYMLVVGNQSEIEKHTQKHK